MAFSRGLYTGWFRGNNNQELVHARFGKKRGVYLGEVRRVHQERIALELAAPLKPGDGVVFDCGHPENDEEGGRVYTVETRGRETLLGFGHGDLDFSRIHAGDKLWKTSDPEMDRRLRQSFAGDAPRFRRPLRLEVHGAVGKPLIVIACDEIGHVTRVESSAPLAVAANQPLTTAKLREQLGRLGGTIFELAALENSLTGSVMLPVSELNRLRREFVARLEALRAQPQRWTLNSEPRHAARTCLHRSPQRFSSSAIVGPIRPQPPPKSSRSSAIWNNSTPPWRKVRATVYCEFENPKKYRDAVAAFRSAQRVPGSRHFCCATAHFQNGRGMDSRTGALLRRGRLSRPQLRSPALLRGCPSHRGLLPQHCEPAGRGLFPKLFPARTRDRVL